MLHFLNFTSSFYSFGKKDSNESLDSSIASNEEQTYSAQHKFSESDSTLVQKREYAGQGYMVTCCNQIVDRLITMIVIKSFWI